MKKIFKKIRLEVYDFDLIISMGQSDVEFKTSMRKFGSVNYKLINNLRHHNISGCAYINEQGRSILRILEAPNDSAFWHGALSHEIFHVVYNLFYKLGIKLSRKSDEAFAYMIGHVTRKIYEELFKPMEQQKDGK